jgi:L-threonylcarbamoyladenylate synthase
MKTQVIQLKGKKLSLKQGRLCLEVVKAGGIVVFPTDTVYGMGCNAFNPKAVKRIYQLKGRDYAKPFPVFLPSLEQLSLIAMDQPKESERLIEKFWPGALTLVFKTAPLALVATQGRTTVAVRIPDHGVMRSLLDMVQLPVVATSANRSGKGSLTKGPEVTAEFEGKVDLILDGGTCAHGRESTVVDVSHYPFSVLRECVISKKQLETVLDGSS